MTAFPIRNDADLGRAIALVDELWDAEPGTPEHDLLDVMSTLIDRYESERSTLPPADPLALMAFKLKELGWSQRELGRKLGWGTGRVSEVLSGKRTLTLQMVRELSQALEIPAGLLVHDSREEPRAQPGHTLPPGLDARLLARADALRVSPAALLKDLVEVGLAGAFMFDAAVTFAGDEVAAIRVGSCNASDNGSWSAVGQAA